MGVQRSKWKALGETFETRPEPVQLVITSGQWNLDAESAKRSQQVPLRTSKYLNQIANEPSIGLYHVQTHIRKAVPKATKSSEDLKATSDRVSAVMIDTDLSVQTLKTVNRIQSYKNIKGTSRTALMWLEKLNSQTVS